MKKLTICFIIILVSGFNIYSQDGAVLESLYTKNEYSINGSLRLKLGRIMPQLYLINYSWIPNDKYNSDSLNYSMASLANGTLLLLYGVAMMMDSPRKEHKNRKLLYYILTPIVAPLYLTNSQTHFILFDNNELKKHSSILSVFIHSQTDIYWAREQIWWRFKPGIGLEYTLRLGENYHISLNAGIIKPIDYLNKNWAQQDFKPMLSLKLIEEI